MFEDCIFAISAQLTTFHDLTENLNMIILKEEGNGVFHVFHVNRPVNIFLLNRKFFYVTKIQVC